MKKIFFGIVLGTVAGLIDIIPMILQNLSWDAMLSAFSMWVISGFLIASTNIKIKGPIKGIIISFLVLIPAAILIGWKEPISLAPIAIMTIILGSILGYLIEKFGQ